jgi:hypothetical protein
LNSSSLRVAFALAIPFCAPALFAQLTSDVVPRERVVAREEQIRRDLENSTLRLGPFRLEPMFMLRDLGYNNNVYGTPDDRVSDWSASVGAGTKWTLPFGSKMYFRGDAVADYTWYAELTERRILGGTYSAALVGLFNRLSVQASAGKQKTFTPLSSELDANVVRTLSDTTFDAEIDLLKRLSVFGTFQGQSPSYEVPGAESGDFLKVDELSRDEQLVRGGIRYRVRSYFDVSLGAERTESTFELSPVGRDNTSEAVILGLHYDRPRIYANVNVASRQGKGVGNSAFPDYSTNTGSYFASYVLVAPIEVQAYGHKRVAYSIFESNAYFFENRNGASLMFRAGDRVLLRAFGELGDNRYPVASPGRSELRVDDATTVGGGFAFRLFRNVALTILLSQSEFDSNLDAFDRSVMRVQSGLSFGGLWR